MEVQTIENSLNMQVNSNENTMEIEIIDRHKRRENEFNDFQHEVKEKRNGKGKRAQEVKADYEQKKADYEPVTDEEKKNDGAAVGQKNYRLMCDVDQFVKSLDEIPQTNKDKLRDSPFAHFFNLKKGLQIDQVCTTLSLYLDDDLKLKLPTEGLKVTTEDFSALMGISDLDSSADDNQETASSDVNPETASSEVNREMDRSMRLKFCFTLGPESEEKWEGISMRKVKKVLNDVNEDENDIKRAFTLMAMHYIVCPPKRTTHKPDILRYVKDVNGINRQPWATIAIDFLRDGRYSGLKTKLIGGCVFLLQLYLMREQDKELDLFKIDKEQIQKFRLKWEQDYAHQSALKGYSQPLVNKIMRDMKKAIKFLEKKKNPISMECLLDVDTSLAKFLSKAAALKMASESVPDEPDKISEEDTATVQEKTQLDNLDQDEDEDEERESEKTEKSKKKKVLKRKNNEVQKSSPKRKKGQGKNVNRQTTRNQADNEVQKSSPKHGMSNRRITRSLAGAAGKAQV